MHARSPKVKLDPIDLKIVAALRRDGRMTKLELAEIVMLSPAEAPIMHEDTFAPDAAIASFDMVFGIFATLAEFERDLIRERTMAGLAAALRQRICLHQRAGAPRACRHGPARHIRLRGL